MPESAGHEGGDRGNGETGAEPVGEGGCGGGGGGGGIVMINREPRKSPISNQTPAFPHSSIFWGIGV